ncbi:unnamed protein product [Dibothriocephalus latus]|uniref:Uncharacterized protein n=1 Tax=Dibothriocephalus latus TaxID=60516 RepID=A0A3P7NNI0_DIBLA|nr:unnamed protein product [Dibothriocephalus latus]
MQPIKIRQKMGFPATDFTEPAPELTSTTPKQEVPMKTTSMGRPMRKSASQFSARRLLKSRASELAHLGTSDSSTDEDWNPMGHAQESSPSSSPLSGGHVASSQRSSLPKKSQVFKSQFRPFFPTFDGLMLSKFYSSR